MAKQKQPNYRLGYYWDDNNAEYVFVLQKDTGSSFKDPEDVAEGDIEWAKRQSKHYGIDLPKSYLAELEEQNPIVTISNPTAESNTYNPNPPVAITTVPSFPNPTTLNPNAPPPSSGQR